MSQSAAERAGIGAEVLPTGQYPPGAPYASTEPPEVQGAGTNRITPVRCGMDCDAAGSAERGLCPTRFGGEAEGFGPPNLHQAGGAKATTEKEHAGIAGEGLPCKRDLMEIEQDLTPFERKQMALAGHKCREAKRIRRATGSVISVAWQLPHLPCPPTAAHEAVATLEAPASGGVKLQPPCSDVTDSDVLGSADGTAGFMTTVRSEDGSDVLSRDQACDAHALPDTEHTRPTGESRSTTISSTTIKQASNATETSRVSFPHQKTPTSERSGPIRVKQAAGQGTSGDSAEFGAQVFVTVKTELGEQAPPCTVKLEEAVMHTMGSRDAKGAEGGEDAQASRSQALLRTDSMGSTSEERPSKRGRVKAEQQTMVGRFTCAIAPLPQNPSRRRLSRKTTDPGALGPTAVKVKLEPQEKLEPCPVKVESVRHGGGALKQERELQVKFEFNAHVKRELPSEEEDDEGLGHEDFTAMRLYLVDSSHVAHVSSGLAYRNSKHLEDKHVDKKVTWGTLVMGCDEGDGWLKVADLYLPLQVEEVLVLKLHDDPLLQMPLETWISMNPLLFSEGDMSGPTAKEWADAPRDVARGFEGRVETLRVAYETPVLSMDLLQVGGAVQVMSDRAELNRIAIETTMFEKAERERMLSVGNAVGRVVKKEEARETVWCTFRRRFPKCSAQSSKDVTIELPLEVLVLAEEQPLHDLSDICAGCKAQVLSDVHAVLHACRKAGLKLQSDRRRLASVGREVRVLQLHPGKNAVLCSVPDVGNVWFAAKALTEIQARSTEDMLQEIRVKDKDQNSCDGKVGFSGLTYTLGKPSSSSIARCGDKQLQGLWCPKGELLSHATYSLRGAPELVAYHHAESGEWRLARVEQHGATTLYYSRIDESMEVPLSGWKAAGGRRPPPTLQFVKDEPENEPTDEMKGEVKDEVKAEMGAASYGVCDASFVKDEVKDEVENNVKDEVKTERREESYGVGDAAFVKDEVKDEIKDGMKDEVKDEVKAESGAESYGVCDVAFVKNEVKDEIKDEMTDEDENETGEEMKVSSHGVCDAAFVKDEVKDEIKVKAEPRIKSELHADVASMAVKQERHKERLLTAVKRETDGGYGVEAELQDVHIKPEPQIKTEIRGIPSAVVVKNKLGVFDATFASRLPLCINQCVAFQTAKKTWAPAKPCCIANVWLQPYGPPAADELKSCYHRLSKQRRHEFRACMDSGLLDRLYRRRRSPYLHRLVHPEVFNRKVARKPAERYTKEQRLGIWKQWPWERDLDPRLFLGNGWMIEDDGTLRLYTTGAACIADIYEGKGQAKVPRKKVTPEEAAATSSEAQAASAPPPPAHPAAAGAPAVYACGGGLGVAAGAATAAAGGAKRVIHKMQKQSCVRGVVWNDCKRAWACRWKSKEGSRTKYNNSTYAVAKYHEEGMNEEDAERAALEAAKAFRAELARRGVTKKEWTAAAYECDVPGVRWEKLKRAWRVKFYVEGKEKIFGSFRAADDSPEEIERAKQLAIQRRQEVCPIEVVHTRPKAASEVVARKSGVPGVRWEMNNAVWEARCQCPYHVEKKIRRRRFRPADCSAETVEAVRQQAVQYLAELRQAPGCSFSSKPS